MQDTIFKTCKKCGIEFEEAVNALGKRLECKKCAYKRQKARLSILKEERRKEKIQSELAKFKKEMQ